MAGREKNKKEESKNTTNNPGMQNSVQKSSEDNAPDQKYSEKDFIPGTQPAPILKETKTKKDSTSPKTVFFFVKKAIKYMFLAVPVIIVAVYFFIMRASFLEPLIKEQFAKNTTGSIDLKITQASLFRGFSLEKVVVQSGADFNNEPIFTADKINLHWNIFGFWAGDFGINEIGIYSPTLSLKSKNNVWNVSTLAKPSEPKEEKEKEEKLPKPESAKVAGDINLPFSVRAFAKVVIENFKLTVDGADKSNSQPIEAGINNFTFRFHLLTERISKIPANPLVLLEKVHTFVVQLNPQEEIDLYFKNPRAATKTPFDLHLLLALDTSMDKPKFKSRLKVGHPAIPVRFAGKTLLPLGVKIDYDMAYNPLRDLFSVNHFQMNVLSQKWLNLQGLVEKATNPEKMNIDFKIDESNINLTALYPHAVRFTGKRFPRFGGSISLAPISIKGSMSDLSIEGQIKMRNVNAALPKPAIAIPFLNLSFGAKADLSNPNLPSPLLRANANMKSKINGADVNLQAEFIPDRKIGLSLALKNFDPAPYAQDKFKGLVNLNLNLEGPSYTNLKTTLQLTSPEFYYLAGRKFSGVNRFTMQIAAHTVILDNEFKAINVNLTNFSLHLKNKRQNDAVRFISQAKTYIRPNNIKVEFRLRDFSAHIRNLYPTLSDEFKELIEPARQHIAGPIKLTGGTDVDITGDTQKIHHLTMLILPEYGIDDVNLVADAVIKPGNIDLSSVHITGFKNALDVKINGSLKEGMVQKVDPQNSDKLIQEPGMVPDVNLDFNLKQKEMQAVFQDHELKGRLRLLASFKNNIAEGSLNMNDLYYRSPTATVNNIQFNFPFRHNLLLRKSLNLTAANKERIIKNYNFTDPDNFTVESVIIPHPIRKAEQIKIIYPVGKKPGFASHIRYKDNVFEIPKMEIHTLNGLISAQDIMFNVGRGKLNEMQYAIGLQIKDIDLKQLIPEEQAAAITDGSIRADLLFIGDRLDQPVENLSGYLSIYKIGEEFGKQAMKVVKPDSSWWIDFTVDNSIIIRKMELDMNEGLVYAKVVYRKGFFGNIISPAGDQILQERIPIPEFLQRAGNEAAVYQNLDSEEKLPPG